MTTNRSQYGSGFVSNRSRRLRTITALLLVVIVAMAVYGTRVLVPGINRAASVAVRPTVQSSAIPTPNVTRNAAVTPLNVTKRQAKVLKLDVMFVAAYWVVWIVLLLSLLLTAWLDLREVSRNYLEQRRELWVAASKAASEAVKDGVDGAEPTQKTR